MNNIHKCQLIILWNGLPYPIDMYLNQSEPNTKRTFHLPLNHNGLTAPQCVAYAANGAAF